MSLGAALVILTLCSSLRGRVARSLWAVGAIVSFIVVVLSGNLTAVVTVLSTIRIIMKSLERIYSCRLDTGSVHDHTSHFIID